MGNPLNLPTPQTVIYVDEKNEDLRLYPDKLIPVSSKLFQNAKKTILSYNGCYGPHAGTRDVARMPRNSEYISYLEGSLAHYICRDGRLLITNETKEGAKKLITLLKLPEPEDKMFNPFHKKKE